jgi:hypothetical protein
MATLRELKQAVGGRYRAAARRECPQILDEFTRVTGYHRKHALRVLHHPFVSKPARSRKRIYGGAVREAPALLWEAADRICGKRLKALLPVLIESWSATGICGSTRWCEARSWTSARDHRPAHAASARSHWAAAGAAVGVLARPSNRAFRYALLCSICNLRSSLMMQNRGAHVL